MARLRYVLVAVIVLALVPWALDSLPWLSCAILTVHCPDESAASVSAGNAPRSPSAADGIRPKSTGTQPSESVASSLAAPGDVNVRPVAVQQILATTARDAAADKPNSSFSFTATLGFGGLVTLKWHVPKETGFDYYLLDRKLTSDNNDAFEREVALQKVDGSGEYSWTDTPARDSYTYRLRALASTDQSDAGTTLGTANVTVDYVIGLAVGDVAVRASSGLVSVAWTAAHEGGVVSYVLDRRLEGAATYDLNVEVGYPQGDGTEYSLFDEPEGTGTFIYRLRATLSNGTDKVLAESGVTL
jgi:hypothetical protein